MSERPVPIEEAMKRLVVIPDYDDGGDDGPRPCVHTLRQVEGVPIALGAHWGLDAVRVAIEKFGVCEAGEVASEMGHSLVVIDDDGPLFLQAIHEGPADD